MTKPLKIKRTQIARAKIKEIYAYSFDQWGETIADKYLADIETVIQQAANDYGGLKRKAKHSKRFTYSPARQHLVFFDIKDDTLFVATVFHGAMNIKAPVAKEMAAIEQKLKKA